MNNKSWLEQHHVETINQWSLDDCFTLLFMSESMQRKLPGTSTAKCTKQKLKERLIELFSQASSKSSTQDEMRRHEREHLFATVINLLQRVLQCMNPEVGELDLLISSEVTGDQLQEILLQKHAMLNALLKSKRQ